MTVIAWDGIVLAADKQATNAGLKFKSTKITRVGGSLLFSAGDADYIALMYQWFEEGALPEKFPSCQNDKDNWVTLNVIKKDKSIWRYERTPVARRVEEEKFACGSGRDYALAAMYMGASAVKAVEIACHFDNGCGLGIDTLYLEPY